VSRMWPGWRLAAPGTKVPQSRDSREGRVGEAAEWLGCGCTGCSSGRVPQGRAGGGASTQPSWAEQGHSVGLLHCWMAGLASG
jgi:hypothetical protein